MADWTVDYILAVLEKKDWSANRLAEESGVAASTISRPLRERGNLEYKLSRGTIEKIYAASGIDPSPYVPSHLQEDGAIFSGPAPKTRAAKILESLPPAGQGTTSTAGSASAPPDELNEIKVATVGKFAHITATIDREGIAKLRKKLDAIEIMLDD